MTDASSRERLSAIRADFHERFPFESRPPRAFFAPGRVELIGNHTDHQRGCAIAAAVDLSVLGLARANGSDTVRIVSRGFGEIEASLSSLAPDRALASTSLSLIRGVADGFTKHGFAIGGFDAYVDSRVLPGSGLSSSAAFELWLCAAMNALFKDGRVSPTDMAKIGRYAENAHFFKPCGLMDQLASAVGGAVYMDFLEDEPHVEKLSIPAADYALVVVDSGADHAGLDGEYASIKEDMCSVARFLGAAALRRVDRARFASSVPALRADVGDRAVMRAMHFFSEQARVMSAREALKRGDFDKFLSLMGESGRSSYMYLDNASTHKDSWNEALALCLCTADSLLSGRGAFRLQGGGFAGTVEAFVPLDVLSGFTSGMEAVFGKNACRVMNIAERGAGEMEVV